MVRNRMNMTIRSNNRLGFSKSFSKGGYPLKGLWGYLGVNEGYGLHWDLGFLEL